MRATPHNNTVSEHHGRYKPRNDADDMDIAEVGECIVWLFAMRLLLLFIRLFGYFIAACSRLQTLNIS
jgi:hypothetical protein